MIIYPKNWDEFQHYKHRDPPWIKLHRKILDDYEFHCLPVASRALAPCLWLIASEAEGGKIDASHNKLAFRLRMTQKELDSALKPLLDSGFFICMQDASNVLAECSQDALSEKSRDRVETEVASALVLHSNLPREEWEQWLAKRRTKRWPIDTVTLSKQLKILAKFDPVTQKEIIDTSINAGWQGLFELEKKEKTSPPSQRPPPQSRVEQGMQSHIEALKILDQNKNASRSY